MLRNKLKHKPSKSKNLTDKDLLNEVQKMDPNYRLTHAVRKKLVDKLSQGQIDSLEKKESEKVLDDEALKEAVKNAVQEVILTQ